MLGSHLYALRTYFHMQLFISKRGFQLSVERNQVTALALVLV